MISNYISLIISGIYSVAGIIFWIRGSMYSYPLLTIFSIIIFILALVAILLGYTFFELKYLIENLL